MTAVTDKVPQGHGAAELRIDQLAIRDFRALGKITMDLGRVNLVIARNGTGKSSLRAAISAALCGDTEWKGKDYPTLAAHVRTGAEKAFVTLDITGIGKVTKRISAKGTKFQVDGWEGTSTEQHAQVMERIGVTSDQLYAILHTHRAVEILPTELAKMVNQLVGAAGARVTPETFGEALVARGVPKDLAEWAVQQWGTGCPADPVEAVRHFRDAVYSERTAFNRLVRDAEANVRSVERRATPPEGVDPEHAPILSSRLDRHRGFRDIAVKQLAKLEAAGGTALRTRMDHERGLVGEVEAEIARLRTVTEQAEQIGHERTAIDARAAQLKAEADPLVAERTDIESRLKHETQKCPKCGTECPECAKAAPQTKAQRKADNTRMQVIMQHLGNIRVELEAVAERRATVEKLADEIKEAELEIARLRKSVASSSEIIRDLERQLGDLEDLRSDFSAEELQAKIAKEDAAIAKCEADIRDWHEYVRAVEDLEQAKADLAAKREQAEELDLLVKTIDQDMVRALAGKEPAADFGAELNAALHGLTDGEYSAQVEARDGGLHTTVTRLRMDEEGKPAGYWFQSVPCQIISESEKFRVGLALQHALLMLVPPAARIMVADGASVLDEQYRTAALRFLMDHRELYSQVIITGTIQRDTVESPVGQDWLRVWWLNRPEDPLVKPGEIIEVFA